MSLSALRRAFSTGGPLAALGQNARELRRGAPAPPLGGPGAALRSLLEAAASPPG